MHKSQTESYLNSLHCPPCQTHNFYNNLINLTSCFSTMVRNAAKLTTTSPAGSLIKLRCGCRCWRLVVQDRRNTRGTSTWDNHQHVRVGGFSAGCRHANVSCVCCSRPAYRLGSVLYCESQILQWALVWLTGARCRADISLYLQRYSKDAPKNWFNVNRFSVVSTSLGRCA